MKKALYILLLLPFLLKGQTDSTVTFKVEKKSSDTIYKYVERLPEFPEGIRSFNTFINSRIIYPKYAIENGIKGTVIVQFVVEIDGRITNIEIVNSGQTHTSLEDEAIRVIRLMPNWIAGQNNGINVRCFYTTPIRFSMK